MNACNFSVVTNKNNLRAAFAQYPTGVAIVTALTKQNQVIALTVNSVSSVSLEPALLSWCLDKRSSMFEMFRDCSEFTISVLAADQLDIASHFAQADKQYGDYFNDSVYHSPPEIAGGCAVFHCIHQQAILLGDHLMLVGKITRVSQSNKQPLAFCQGQFSTIAQLPSERLSVIEQR